jgi:hypothetical protein
MKFPLVISFYTKDTPYQLDAHHLMASCDTFGVEYHIEGIDSYGSWELNCAYKPFFIIEKLRQFECPVLWVDVDAVFAQRPKSLKVFEKDFAIYSQADLAPEHPSKVRSGTIYVNHTQRGIDVLKSWIQECQKLLVDPERTKEFWDQIALRNVYLAQKNLGRLPLSYIKILGHPVDVKCPKPVIIHCQASRHAKKG